jgi:hypothetical protein
VNFNVNFKVLLSKYIVHPLVKIKKTDNIKMHGITVEKNLELFGKKARIFFYIIEGGSCRMTLIL